MLQRHLKNSASSNFWKFNFSKQWQINQALIALSLQKKTHQINEVSQILFLNNPTIFGMLETIT